MLRTCLLKPFRPGAVVDTHSRVAQQVSSQDNVTRGDTTTTGGPQWFLQVHPCLSEQFGQALGLQLLSIGIHESREGHVDRTREMAGQRICAGEREE